MKINLLVVCLYMSSILTAQIQKGALFLGGDLQIYSYNTTSTSPNQFTSKNSGTSFSPSIGWVIKENMVVGGSLLLSFSNSEQEPRFYQNKGNRIGAGIFIRKYIPLGKSFYLFGNAALNGQSVYSKYIYVQQPSYYTENGYAINAVLIPGVAYQVKKYLFLELALNNLLSLGYERKNTDDHNSNGNIYKSVSNNYSLYSSFGNGVPLQVGLRWMIAKK